VGNTAYFKSHVDGFQQETTNPVLLALIPSSVSTIATSKDLGTSFSCILNAFSQSSFVNSPYSFKMITTLIFIVNRPEVKHGKSFTIDGDVYSCDPRKSWHKNVSEALPL